MIRARSPSLHRVASFILLGVAIVGLVVVGCNGDRERPPLSGGWGGGSGVATGPCAEEDQRECGYKVEEGGGVVLCYRGVQSCREGMWSRCEDGELTSQAKRTTKGFKGFDRKYRPLALSTPESCDDDCDPECMFYDEDPPDITPDPGGTIETIPDWSNPPTLVCSHALCSTGTALDPTCSPCVQTVCNLNASCCSSNWSTACVNLVTQHCGSTTPSGPNICDYTLFSETTITGGNNDGILVGGPIGAGQTSGTAINLGNVTVDRVVTAGSITLDQTEVKYTVSWNGSLTCQNNPTVASSTCPSGTTTTGGSPYPPNTPASGALPTIPTHDVICINQSGTVDINSGTQSFNPGEARRININNNAARAVLTGPGTYYGVHFNAPGTLVFAQPGTYTFNYLHFGGNDPKVLMPPSGTGSPPSGTVKVDVCTNLHFDNNVQVYQHSGSCVAPSWTCAATTNRPSAGAVIWYTEQVCSGSSEVKVGPGALVSGILIAPDCKVHIYSGNGFGTIQGVVYSSSIQLEPGVMIDATGLVGDVCKATGVGGSSTPTCSFDATVPAMPPPFNEPCESGLDCQVNSRCTNVDTDNACAHSKCIQGAALSATCRAADTCVDRICAADSTCCTTAWTASCVNRVKTTCDSWCGPTTGCGHDMCTTGSALTKSCDTGSAGANNCSETVCNNASFAYCCNSASGPGWDSACVNQAKAVCLGSPTPSSGTVFPCPYTIVGNSLNLGGTGGITGTTLTAPNSVPVQNPVCGGTGNTTAATMTYPAGTRNNVTIPTNVTMTLGNGDHYMSSLTLAASSTARLAVASGANVRLFICGNLSVGSQAQMMSNAFTGADLARLQVFVKGTITIADRATTRGLFRSEGNITLNGHSTTAANHYGTLWSNGSITRNGTVRTNITQSIPASTCGCPVTTPAQAVTAEDGTCVLNEEGFIDTSCSMQDLAVQFACDNDITVCNHGNVAAASGATLKFYPRTGQQFATTSPNATWAEATTCTVGSAIAAGACVTQTCPAAVFDQDLTMMVTAAPATTECSALDNWSMYQNGGVCIPIGGDSEEVVSEVYEGDCPDDMFVRWELLGWESTAPGDSRIEWWGRVASTEAGLTAKTLQSIGEAHDGMTDTQSCPIGSSCDINLATTFWGNQPVHQEFLEIEARVIGENGDVPTLEDWQVRYTCQYDQ